MFLIDFFFPVRAKATSKQICVKSGFRPVAFKEGRQRTSGQFVCLFNSSASRLPSSSCEQVKTQLQLCIQCCRHAANCSRPPHGAAKCFHVAPGCRAAKCACHSQGPQTKEFFFYYYLLLSPQRLPKAVCGCCFGIKASAAGLTINNISDYRL